MRILIIGGNRFFGLQLAKLCLDSGHTVTLLNRGHHEDGLGTRVDRIKVDRRVVNDLATAVHGKSWDLVYDIACYDAVGANASVLELLPKIDRYVLISTKSVYAPQDLPFNERDFNAKELPLPATLSMGVSYRDGKRQAEAVFARAEFKNFVAIRPSYIIGPVDPHGRTEKLLSRIAREESIRIPNLDAATEFIRTDQLARAIQKIGESNFTGAINCAAPGTITQRRFLATCGKIVGKKVHVYLGEGPVENGPYAYIHSMIMDLSVLRSLGIEIEPITLWMEPYLAEIQQRLTEK